VERDGPAELHRRSGPSANRRTADYWREGRLAPVGHFFTTLTIGGLTGLLAALTVALLAGGYATVRRLTI
jgi:hypothetical protein